jgi:hypothetical protein
MMDGWMDGWRLIMLGYYYYLLMIPPNCACNQTTNESVSFLNRNRQEYNHKPPQAVLAKQSAFLFVAFTNPINRNSANPR